MSKLIVEKYIYFGEDQTYYCWKNEQVGMYTTIYIEKWRIPTPIPTILECQMEEGVAIKISFSKK